MTSVLLPFSCCASWRLLACSNSVLTGGLRGVVLEHMAQQPTTLVVAKHCLQHCTNACNVVDTSAPTNVADEVLAKHTHCKKLLLLGRARPDYVVDHADAFIAH